jgi:hypothetical protein
MGPHLWPPPFTRGDSIGHSLTNWPSAHTHTHTMKTPGPVQCSKLLLVLASTAIIGFEFHETHDHILLSDGSGNLQTNLPESESYVTTGGQSASLSWSKQPSGAYDHSFITVRQLRVCWCGALSLTRGRVCRLQMLLALLTSAVILGCESRGTRDHILLYQTGDFPFSLPSTTRRATVEVFDSASTWDRPLYLGLITEFNEQL